MRIRYRRPPPAPPSSPSDLQSSICSSTDDEDRVDRRPSDLHLAAVSGTNVVDSVDVKLKYHSTRPSSHQGPPVNVGEEEDELVVEENLTAATNRRMGYNHGIETSAGGSIVPSPSHEDLNEMAHWCEEDKVFPLKKRRASFISKVRERERTIIVARDVKDSNVRETKKINKNLVEDCDFENGQEEEDEDAAKKGESGSNIMEASGRCSRKNGRGWRCHRPTLVGCSMCEYHRNQSKVRGLKFARRQNGGNVVQRKKKFDKNSLYLEADKDEDEDEDDTGNDDEDKKGFMKKRKRIRVLSLLGQTLPSPAPPVMF